MSIKIYPDSPYPEGMTRNYNDWSSRVSELLSDSSADLLDVDRTLTDTFATFVNTSLISHDYKEARKIAEDYREHRIELQLRMFKEMEGLYEEMAETSLEISKLQEEAETSSKA